MDDRTISTTNDLSPVVYGGGKWVVGSNQGVIYYSTDASSWSASGLPTQSAGPMFMEMEFSSVMMGLIYMFPGNGLDYTLAYVTGESTAPTRIAFLTGFLGKG